MLELYINRRTGWGGSRVTFYIGHRGWSRIVKRLPEVQG